MFNMLFAIGFTIQLERLEARDATHARAIYLRRCEAQSMRHENLSMGVNKQMPSTASILS